MSMLVQANGDDHPEAAGKHLDDARILEQRGRPDGAAYLAGYAVECCLKTLIIVESGSCWGHDLVKLANVASKLSASAGAKTARYVSEPSVMQLSTSSIASWDPGQRYRALGHIGAAGAADWVKEATAIYDATVVRMRLDGVF